MTVEASNSGSQGATAVAIEKATFGAGCFWGVEARLAELTGVIDTAAGYEGGDLEHPTYKEVCTDRTGHAEVVQVTFDPSRLSYETLLDAFFALHDPTQVNRQGPDWGTQYRSVIFANSDEQFMQARDVPSSHSHPGHARGHLLEGRRVPPEVPREARHGELSHLNQRKDESTTPPQATFSRRWGSCCIRGLTQYEAQ